MRRNRFSNRASEIRRGATDCLYAARILNPHDDSPRLLTIVNVNLALTVRGRRTNLIKPPEDFREILIEMEERGSAGTRYNQVGGRRGTPRYSPRVHTRASARASIVCAASRFAARWMKYYAAPWEIALGA